MSELINYSDESDNSQVIVQNKLFLVKGFPGSGKTFFAASLIGALYREIHSNVQIYFHGEKVSNDLFSIQDIKKLKFSREKGVIILDEAGVNMNSKNFQSEENKMYGELAMLGRKLNKDIIVISQLDFSVDKTVRSLAQIQIEMHSWRVGGGLMFSYKTTNSYGDFLNQREIDLFTWAKLSGFSYSSLESSRINSTLDSIENEEDEFDRSESKRARRF